MPEKPYTDPGNYNRIAQRLAEDKGWFWANQFDNVANRDGLAAGVPGGRTRPVSGTVDSKRPSDIFDARGK